ncbi:MAG: hypothetical protein HY552_01875 [Elusimicrobia bacterium]|nr:hypothetical protein [Elusimicrobiota bacterium]
MNPECWTVKNQQALADAQALARERGHQELSEEHALAALLAQKDGVVPETLRKAGLDPADAAREVERALAKKPQSSGAQPHASPDLEKALAKAEDRMKAMRDEFVSVEHLLLGLLDNGDGAAKLLARLGLTPDRFLAALTQVRGSRRAT